jgi:SP family facilitated glucose transporter-like MFS transporter 1
MTGGGCGGAPMTASFAAQMNAKPNVMTFVSITIVMMGALMFGIDQANFGLVHGKQSFSEYWCPKFHFKEADLSDPTYDPTFCSKIGGLQKQPSAWVLFNTLGLTAVPAGMGLGCLTLAPVAARRWGRRPTISLGGLACFVGCVITSYLSVNVPVYLVGRVMTGFGCGIACYCLPMYQSEVATIGIRGLMGSLFQFMVALGGLVATMLLSVIQDWQQGFMLPGYAGLLVGVAVWMCPESPRYVINRFGKEAGRPVLQRVRNGDIEIELEFIDSNLQEEKRTGTVAFSELFTKPGLRLRVFTACYLQAAQQFTGINAFLGYETDIFVGAGVHTDDVDKIPFGPAFLLNITMLLGCILGLILVDSPVGGRRRQLNAASALMGPPLILAAVSGWLGWQPWVALVSLFVFGFGFQLAWGIVPWFYPAELFTMQEREMALSLSTFTGFAMNLAVTFIAPALLQMSPNGTFFVFGLLNVTNVIFVLACVKETKGVPLEDIPALFGGVDAKDSKTIPFSQA